jgi:hypothetical protein
MPQPSPDVHPLCADLLQDLPPETGQMAREFTAVTRARKIKTPAQLLRGVLLYWGLDTSLREVAGPCTRLVARLTESSVAERVAACRPWGRALLAKMLPRVERTELPGRRRLRVIDASGLQAPGARGPQYRLHLCMDLGTLAFPDSAITDQRTGERLTPFPLGAGDIAVAARGSWHPAAIVQSVQRGADVRLRLTPHNVPMSQRDGVPADLVAVLWPQAAATVCTLPVLRGHLASPERVEAGVHAYRLPPDEANRARQLCSAIAKKGTSPRNARCGWLVGPWC